MNKLLSQILLLLSAALLLPGCDDESSTAYNRELLTEDELPGERIESYEDLKRLLDDRETQAASETIAVIDTAGITALREQAAAENKVLVIDCWATWCGSCVAMFPHLHKAMKQRGDGVMLVSLSFDEGQELAQQAAEFLIKQKATDNAYRAAEGTDATAAIAKVLSDNWSGTLLPAVFVYRPDGTTAFELLETRGEVQDWVDQITSAVDQSLPVADDAAGQ